MVTFLTAVLHKAVTIMIPSLGYSEYWMTPLVRIVQLPGLTFCGASNWRSKAPQVELGLELLVPPMWRFLLSGFGPPYVDAVNSSTPLQRDNILMPLPQQVCGSRDLDSQLQWLVPQDALSAAVTLGSIGGCSRALSRNLDELGELAVIVTGNTEVPWAEVERKALRCSWGIGAAYWDVQVDSNLWPKALNCSDSSACSELCAAGGQLRAFLCVPSRFAVEAGTRLLEPQPECNAEGILDQALGLLLAHRTGCWEFLAAAGPPTNAFLAGGGRDLPGRMDDAISHHGKWVQQIRSQRATLATESASLPSAAVCVAGRARSLIEPEVYRSIAQNAVGLSGLGAETSLFFVLDLDKRPMSELMDAFAALPPTAIAIFDKDGARSDWGMPGLPGSCEAWRRCGVACYHQFHKLQTCLRLIEAAEASRGKRFDWFVRIRPDTKWEAPIGDLAEFDQGAVHMSLTNFGENDDNFALVPRAFANAYFAISESCPEPHEAYQSTCAIPWVGSHIYPECAIQMRLKEMQVPWEPFPNIYRIKREAVCRPDDPRGCGRCEIGVCNVAPPD
ncbi:unnamed protein product [Polarella glacialis]|uniref:Uncharacterized protein n=1 Tax=Polarella glacialis TaxID=89957 RepID=A0A813GNS8_POLGL|nr:unnamed protein product [Polarella glacialis]